MEQNLRTPIVSVMGHVDHGKTSVLDKIRGTAVVDREAGLITQHIGATEVPLDVVKRVCGPLFKGDTAIPGLLFIDTPGHRAFTTLRTRGGALSDLAVVVIDINEGFQPQTLEVIDILKRFKTPFVVVANKIDKIHGWNPQPDQSFILSFQKQQERVRNALDEKIYIIIGKLYELGFSSDRYDRVRDFQKNIGVIPISAKTGEGMPDLLMVLMGLARKFLEKNLQYRAVGPGTGAVLEVKEEVGLGTTLDVILYDGELKVGDTIVVGSLGTPIVTKVRALLKPRPLSDMRVEDKFKHVDKVVAASGIKIAAPNLEKALSGSEVRVATDNVDEISAQIKSGIDEVLIETETNGIMVKADTIGSLEALLNEFKKEEIPIRKASIGDISKRDIAEVKTIKEPLFSVIVGFDVDVLPDAREELADTGIKLFVNDVIYKLIEDYRDWVLEQKQLMEKSRYEAIIKPGRFKILPDCTFRQSKPAVVGVRVLGGIIKTKLELMKEDGSIIGRIKGIQEHNENIGEATAGMEVAVAIDGPIVGRQIKEGDTLYIDVPEKHAKISEQELFESMGIEDKESLMAYMEIKRRDNPFWGK
ncbi:MAG: translation initiation factor IF-2 [Candidatus Methanoperedens sp.]|jgi:translation initiation factor 5B|nr:translation initiation factor IF-2 [Candidatus Methanoperedens sp.]PKL54520.1 MAG: translation initiation factor IF-2 [Candidatus Methanoperedenaceae archaeon HGW-Methanoperedenaceae-1]